MIVSPFGFQRVDGLLHAAAEFVRSVVEALFEIRHLGRVAHGSRQAFQLGAEDFAGDEVHIRFPFRRVAGLPGPFGWGRSRLAAGSMGEAAASPPVKRLGRWKGAGRGFRRVAPLPGSNNAFLRPRGGADFEGLFRG